MSDEVAIVTNILMVVITAAYVVATIFICEYNKKSADAAKAQTEELKRQFDEQNRPYITVYFDLIRSRILCLVIENTGNKPAHDVNIDINDKFIENIKDNSVKKHLYDFCKDKIILASKQKVYVYLGGINEYDNIASVQLSINIKYDKYTDHAAIDLNQYRTLMIYGTPLEDIAQCIKTITDNGIKCK